MTYFAAIGGMQLKNWTDYLKIIWPTIRVLQHAKKSDGCVHATMFKDGDVYFAVSVWDDSSKMKNFACSGLHGRMVNGAMETMSMFYNHTEECDQVPDKKDCVAYWKNAMEERSGRATVGSYKC